VPCDSVNSETAQSFVEIVHSCLKRDLLEGSLYYENVRPGREIAHNTNGLRILLTDKKAV
jgi:hypothetical protein